MDLLEREGHLSTAGLVAAEVVLVETVEDLMVGEDADAEVAVDETLVECLVDGIEGDISRIGQYILQALVLLLAVGTDVYLVALRQIVSEGLLEQVKVLVEQRLHRDGKSQMDDGRCRIGGAVAEFDAAEVEGVGEERGALCELEFTTELALDVALFHLRGGLELFTLRLGREAFLVGAVDGVVDVEEVFRHEEHVVGHEREERDLFVIRHREFRHDLNLVALFMGELVLHLERTDGVDIIAKEVDAVRQLVAVGEHVKD